MKKRTITSFINNVKPAYIICMAAIFSVCITPLKAQSGSAILKANDDTRFTTPGTAFFYNVLDNDELGTCKYNTLQTFKIIQAPKHGTAVINPLTKLIRYTPAAGYSGQDSLIYQIECSGVTSTATAYININSQPDNVWTDVCTVTPPATVWDIEKKAQTSTANYVSYYAQPFVGDLDKDGRKEIVTTAFTSPFNSLTSTAIHVFDDNLNLKKTFTTPVMDTYVFSPIILADVDNDGQGEIVIATSYNSGGTDKFRLKCYTASGGLKWTSDQPYFTAAGSATILNYSMCPVVADFDADGTPEIFVGDRLFDGKTGKLLVTLPAGPRGLIHTGATRYAYMSAFGDLDKDGKLEVIAGSAAYKVNIVSRTNPALNSATIYKQATTPTGRSDGYTSVADVNGDGYLDVIVVTYEQEYAATGNIYRPTLMYVWDGKTGALLNSVSPPQQASPTGTYPYTGSALGSRAFIGDINGDGIVEICFTYYCGIVAYRYNKATNNFTQLWVKRTTDSSGSTTMSMFDFNLDGRAELVYRDETDLRIIDGITGNNLITFPCYSPTHTEYPVVVDLDNDGHADILTSGSIESVYATAAQTMRIMRFGSKTLNAWCDARDVWNQHGYNPVYINEDLTVPQYPINPATAFHDKDSPKINYPFNHFLQQVTNLNEEGETLYFGPDLMFSPSVKKTLKVNGSDLDITIGVMNDGDAIYSGNLRISTYVYKKATNTYTKIGAAGVNVTVSIPADGSTQTITYKVLNFAAYLPADYDNWEIRLNWEDATYPINQEECKYYNNIASDISLIEGEYVMCYYPDASRTERVYVEPQNTYRCEWYTASTGGTHVASGDYYDVPNNSITNKVQYYFVEVYDKVTNLHLNPSRDTVFVYQAPDSLIWIGHTNQDWHNYENWLNPNDPLNLYEKANIPRKCTDVLIPDEIDLYSDLTPSLTVYSKYAKSECANITFEHGGEVARTDSLDYDAAYVHLTLKSNRWYMLSAPLQGMFPGDYYVQDPKPCDDDVFVYTRLFDRTNPETGNYVAGNWTGEFNNPDYQLSAGLGFSAWVDDKQPNDKIHTPSHFLFPKHDATYTMYNATRTDLGDYINCSPRNTVPLTRINEHRFVYEPGMDMYGDFTLNASAPVAGRSVIVGNPFMAHWDFNQFRAANTYAIQPYYQVLDENGSFITYYISGGTTTGGLTKYIAPMQSVLVMSSGSFPALVANATMTSTVPGDKLRSIQQETSEELLSLKVIQGDVSNKTILYYHPEGTPEGFVDVPKSFVTNVTEPATVYMVSEKGNLSDILNVDELNNPVFLGIRTSLTGEMEFKFEGTRTFASDYDIYLTDVQTARQIDLRVFPYYKFEKTTSDLFTSNRFYLTFVKNTTGISASEMGKTTGVEVYSSEGTIHIISVDNALLKEVTLYDIQGRIVQTKKNINDTRMSIPAEKNKIYLVRAVSGTTSRSVKIYNR